MLFFAYLIAVSLFANSVRGAYYMRTLSDETAIYSGMAGFNFQGGWVDSLGTVYFAKPSTRAVQIFTPAGNTSLIGPSSQSFSGASGPASSVQLDGVDSITGDTSGNLYISSGVLFIWKYDRSSGIVSRFAGATPGTSGFSGDRGQATAAKLNSPLGIFLSSNGILFFADFNNNRIRTINTVTGIIDTFAGSNFRAYAGDLGPVTSASLSSPTSVWGSSDGVIYIADYRNNRIRQVDTSGIITTFAGNGNTTYNGDNIPATSAEMTVRSISGDFNGNILLVDANSNRIRMITGGIIRTIAGNGNVGGVSQVFKLANTSIPSPERVFADPVSGVIYFTSEATANILLENLPTTKPTSAPTNAQTNIPTDFPTFAPSFKLTESPTASPTNPPNTPSNVPSFRPSSSPTNKGNNNNSTLSSDSHSNERMSDLHIFYATFFPAFFVLCCILLGMLVYVSCYANGNVKNNEKGGNNNNNEKNAYEKVGGEGNNDVVVKKERYYEMWF